MAWIINEKTNMKWEIEDSEVVEQLLMQEEYKAIDAPTSKKSTKTEKGK